MFGRAIKLFTVFGFEVRLDPSWFLLAFLITWTLAVGFFPFTVPGLPQSTYWWMGVAGAIGLFVSIVWHELSHSLVARHYDLAMRGITLFVFGGVAEMEHEPATARSEFLMAVAGPASSVVFSAICYGLFQAGRDAWPVVVTGVLAYLAWINIILAIFNMIPAFPLDGGRVLRAALWHYKGNLKWATRVSAAIGGGFGVLLMILSVWQLFMGNFIGAIWWFLIGLFIRNASRMSYQQLMIRQALEGEPVRRFMRTEPITVSPDISVAELVEDYFYRHHYKMFPVVSDSHLVGCVSAADVKEVPREQWAMHRVSELNKPCSLENTIAPDTDAVKALAKMNESDRTRLMVVEGDRLVGIVSLRDLLGFLAMKMDLESNNGESVPLPTR